WYMQAESLNGVWSHRTKARRRDYVKRRLDFGDEPGQFELPRHFDRVDKWLPDLGTRLTEVLNELAALPGDIDAALRNRIGLDEYDTTLRLMGAISNALHDLGSVWHRPRRGQPSWEIESYAFDLLVCAIEDVTGEEF